MLPLEGRVVERVLLEALDLAADVAVGVDVHVDLQRGEAPFQHVVHHRADLVEVHARLDLAVGVDADLVAELAAHQFVDRHAQRLALEIPERDLDAGQRRDQRAARAAVEDMRPAHLLKDGVDGKRVAADELLFQVADDGNRLLAAVDAFAQPGDAGVGLHLDPQMHAVALGGRGLDGRDLHDPLLRFLIDNCCSKIEN